jgi:phosphatidylserine/phosphatidylglycerophosphate/cardiolipin synthase-like enzyme
MRRRGHATRLLSVACAVVLAATLWTPSAQAGTYTPPDGVIFNRPADAGTWAEKYAIRTHVDRTIDATRKGETIRVAQWAINFKTSADKLVAAHRRGVNVKILLDDKHNYQAHRQLRRVLGTNRKARSFIYVCDSGCRIKRGGAMHSKFLTFSKAGDKKNVVMMSTANLTGPGATWGWNDNNTWSGRKKLYDGFVDVFTQMTRDRAVKDPFTVVTQGPNTVYFFPQPGATLSQDPISRALSKVRCTGARDGAGIGGRTVIRVAMFGMIGTRGMHLARKLRLLDAEGCRVEVILAKPARKVIMELRRPGPNGGVTVHDSRYDRDLDGRPDKYVHLKTMMISGHYDGDRSAWTVFTGSQNWFPRSQTHDDETVVQMRTRSKWNQYNRHFLDIWNNHSYLRPNKPLDSYSTFGLYGVETEDPWPYMGPLPESE